MRNFYCLLLGIALISSLVGCRSTPVYVPPPDWKYADLRALDPADDIPPSQDLLALYLRRADEDIEIRLDLLDFTTPLDCNLALRVASASSGEKITIHIAVSGEISAVGKDGLPIPDLMPRVTWDTFLDTMVISLNRASLIHSGLPFVVTAYSSDAKTNAARDQIGPVPSDAPPPQPAQVMFTFWNTFPAATPAQALRMWDGAHSGPGRSRFGLHYLLSAVKADHVPVVLLDLKTSNSLSILDYMGKLPEVQTLADLHLAILPEVAQYDLPAEFIRNIPIRNLYPFKSSPFLYTSVLPAQIGDQYRVAFIASQPASESPNLTRPYRWQDRIIIPLPGDETGESSYIPTPDGPSEAARRDLIQAALNPAKGIYVLGGTLANSAWGDPACVTPTLQYLTAHPWIRFLSSDDLLTLHTEQAYTPNPVAGQANSTLADKILPALLGAPSGTITNLAWEAYLSLLTPASPELQELRAGYFGVVGHLLVAARWASRPGNAQDCTVDIDWDGQPECILASPNFLATFELNGGYIVTAFVRTGDGVHQVIAPYAQFTVGLGDPSTWDLSRGSEADPALVPGGFVDDTRTWMPQTQAGQITFTNAEDHATKIFRLTETGLRVEYSSATPLTVKISLALDPWRRFTPGWGDAYHETSFTGGGEWSLDPDLQVKITTSGTLSAHAFNQSRATLAGPEDPNFDYPPGHYLPFPVAVVEVDGQNNFFIQVDVR